jgi:Sulfate permease and related transporters (MFS superfamily)
MRIAPGWERLRHYRRDDLRGDAIGGLTVTAYLVPQVMAYSTLAGLPPVSGLWVIVVGFLLYAIVGSSRLLSVGLTRRIGRRMPAQGRTTRTRAREIGADGGIG